MYHVSAQGVDERMMNGHYYYYKRFKRMLFIRTKRNMQIFRVIPFIKLQNDKRLNGEKR